MLILEVLLQATSILDISKRFKCQGQGDKENHKQQGSLPAKRFRRPAGYSAPLMYKAAACHSALDPTAARVGLGRAVCLPVGRVGLLSVCLQGG